MQDQLGILSKSQKFTLDPCCLVSEKVMKGAFMSHHIPHLLHSFL